MDVGGAVVCGDGVEGTVVVELRLIGWVVEVIVFGVLSTATWDDMIR